MNDEKLLVYTRKPRLETVYWKIKDWLQERPIQDDCVPAQLVLNGWPLVTTAYPLLEQSLKALVRVLDNTYNPYADKHRYCHDRGGVTHPRPRGVRREQDGPVTASPETGGKGGPNAEKNKGPHTIVSHLCARFSLDGARRPSGAGLGAPSARPHLRQIPPPPPLRR